MDLNQRQNIKNRLKSRVWSLSIDRSDLEKFCHLLQERSSAAAEIEVHEYERREQQTDEQYADTLKTLRESFVLRLTVTGINGEELYGTIKEVFASVNFPENVRSLFVNSEHVLRDVHNYYARNSFLVHLDFTKPAIFDLSLLPSQGSPNDSNYEVQGYDATWVNGLFHEVSTFLLKRSSSFSKVHKHSVYDVLLWILGFPLAFWTCFRLSPAIETVGVDTTAFLRNALYVYCFVACLFLFRILFHYLRWVCPLVEYRWKGSKINAHRVLLGLLLTGLVVNFLYDVVKLLAK